MLTIAICDDNANDRNEMIRYCKQYGAEKNYDFILQEYERGEDLLDDLNADILLLDIKMDGVDGIEIKNILQHQKSRTGILFLSNYLEAIPEAFGRQVYGFLKKPVEYEQFQKKMDFMVDDILEQNQYVYCETINGSTKIAVSEINYIKAEGKYTKIFLADKNDYIFSKKSIGEWKAELAAYGFSNCHRSYLVNYNYVESIMENVKLCGNVCIPMSRRMEKVFQEGYKNYLWKRAK